MNTKKIITDAAFSLFREFPFDAITVQMILNRAEVSRKTFYKYFKDKYELMELNYRKVMDQHIRDYYNGHNWYDILMFLYDYINEERMYFKHVSDISGPDSFWSFLREYSLQFYSSIKLYNEKRQKLTEEERLTILMIIEGQMSVFKEVVDGTTSINREDFARILCSIMPDSYKNRID
ncbi:MAG: TetR family transcriptional regulator [bacterium]|nr:TetR family transcriptional regulator [bacterium]